MTEEQKELVKETAEKNNLSNERVEQLIQDTLNGKYDTTSENQQTTNENKTILPQAQQVTLPQAENSQNQTSNEISTDTENTQKLTEQQVKNNQIFEESIKKVNENNPDKQPIDINNKAIQQMKSLADATNNILEFSDDFENDRVVAKYEDGKITINAKADTQKALQNIAIHEAIHSKSGTKGFDKLKNLVLDYVTEKGEYNTARTDLNKIYSEKYKSMTAEEFDKAMDEEVVTNTLGEYFGSEEKLNEILNNMEQGDRRTFLEKAIDLVKDIVNRLSGYKDEQQYFKSVQTKLEKVLSNQETSTGNNNYAIENKTEKSYNDIKLGEIRNIQTKELMSLYNEGGYRTEEQLSKLRKSIQENGIIEPIEIYKKDDGTFGIENGNHRLQIANELGIEDIPVKLVESWKNIGITVDNTETNILKERIDKSDTSNSISKTNIEFNEKSRSGRRGLYGINDQSQNRETTKRNAQFSTKESYSDKQTSDTKNKENNKQIKNSNNKSCFSLQEKQLDIIKNNNTMTDNYHVGIRNIEDIKTFEEAMQDEESFVYGDFSKEDAQKALEKGKVTVYSSKPIEQGGFVSTSKKMAQDYAGKGKVYSQEVNLNDVAWINGDEGQYAKVDNSKYAYESNGAWQSFVEKYFKSEGTKTTLDEARLPEREVTIKDYQDVLDKADYIPSEDKQALLKETENVKMNQTSLKEFEKIVADMEETYKKLDDEILDTSKTYSTGREETYKQYKKSTTEYDSTALEEAKNNIQANLQGRRTKAQWLEIAKQMGTEISNKSKLEN